CVAGWLRAERTQLASAKREREDCRLKNRQKAATGLGLPSSASRASHRFASESVSRSWRSDNSFIIADTHALVENANRACYHDAKPRSPLLFGIHQPDGRILLAEPQVFLVGAGPGNAGLLTLRAVECLAQADVVLYDRLVPPRCLDHAPATALRVCVRELAESHVDRVPHINQMLVDAARQGKRVVRLK